MENTSPHEMTTNPLVNFRIKRKISQANVASQLKIAQPFLSEVERGVKNFSLPNLQKIIKYYNDSSPLTEEEKVAIANYFLFKEIT